MRATLIFLCAAVSLGAAELGFSARDLKVPSFDSAGHLIRRLTADSATGPSSSTRLDKGRVEFFATQSDESIAVLDFEQALYRGTEERISSDSAIKLTAQQGTVSGRGYDCLLEAGLLELKSDVKFYSNEFHLAGKAGTVRFDPKGTDKDSLIKEAVVTGGVTVERTATVQAPFDRAETEFARYGAAEQKVFLKIPVTVWKKGQRSIIEKTASGFFEIDLKPTGTPAP